MVHPGRSAADVAAIRRNAARAGVLVQVAPDPDTEVWPDHWAPMKVMNAMATQWNVSQTGVAIGLRYEALPVVLDLLEVPKDERRALFGDLQVLEAEMRKAMKERGPNG